MSITGWVSDLYDVLRRGTLVTLNDVELDTVALVQSLEAITLDCRVVNKTVFGTIILRDETEALGVVEPLNCTLCHCNRIPLFEAFRLALHNSGNSPDTSTTPGCSWCSKYKKHPGNDAFPRCFN